MTEPQPDAIAQQAAEDVRRLLDRPGLRQAIRLAKLSQRGSEAAPADQGQAGTVDRPDGGRGAAEVNG